MSDVGLLLLNLTTSPFYTSRPGLGWLLPFLSLEMEGGVSVLLVVLGDDDDDDDSN